MDRAKIGNSAISTALAAVEPLAHELICENQIAEAAGYKKPRYFLDKHYLACTTSLSNGVLVQRGPTGAHYYELLEAPGERWTHPNSAAAVGEEATAQKQQRVPGWWNKPTDQSSGGTL
jgi:hypothetical protein